jgi:hypothetical protein
MTIPATHLLRRLYLKLSQLAELSAKILWDRWEPATAAIFFSQFPCRLGAGTDNCCDLPMKFRPVIAIFAALVAPIGRAALEIKGRLGEHVFTLLEGTTGRPSQLAHGREAGRWMRVDGEGSGVTAEKLASRLRFSPEFAHKVADAIAPGTTVIVTDAPAVRKPVVDSTYFAAN